MIIKKSKIHGAEEGLASILVSMIIMLIISLIVLGFAQLSRREQRQSLDDQLSTQAFYAAESGVNDAVKVLHSTSLAQDYTTGCNDFISAFSLNNTLDSSSGVQYTCLLVSQAPDSIHYDDVSTDSSVVLPLKAQSGSLSSVTISWQDNSGGSTFCPTLGSFTPAPNWPCTTGVLRADMVAATATNRSQLNSQVMTNFLYPLNSGKGSVNTVAYNPANTGAITSGECGAAGNGPSNGSSCSVTITGLSGNQYLRLKSIYRHSSVTITGTDTSGNQVKFVGVQAVIDATGKANDVLRRIQVRVPLISNDVYPEFAIQSGDSICKRLQIDPSSGAASTDTPGVPACSPFSL